MPNLLSCPNNYRPIEQVAAWITGVNASGAAAGGSDVQRARGRLVEVCERLTSATLEGDSGVLE